MNGISILETRYTTSAMQQVYGSTIVPIVSSNDKLFLKQHFFHSHTYARSDSNLRVHTDLSLTLSKAKYGVMAVTSDRLRIIYRTFLKSCTGCKLQRSEAGGEYKHQLGNPRLMDLLGVENPLYHTVSADLVRPFNVSQYQGARGRMSRFKLHGLFIADLATSLTTVILWMVPQNLTSSRHWELSRQQSVCPKML